MSAGGRLTHGGAAAASLLVLGALWTPAAAQEPVPGAGAGEEVAAAVDRFARGIPQERAMAESALVDLGPSAVEPLRRAVERAPDLAPAAERVIAAIRARTLPWEAVLDADVVVAGVAHVEREAVEAALRENPHMPYARFRLSVSGVSKEPHEQGAPRGEIEVMTWDPRVLLDVGEAACVAALRGDDRGEWRLGAIVLAAPWSAEEARREVAAQRVLLDRFPGAALPASAPEEEVAALVEGLLVSGALQRSVDGLVALGAAAVPAIIYRLDDRRPLAARGVQFAHLHYTPKQVIDCLAAVLHRITGRSFGFIYNGATDAERAATLAKWRVFFMKTVEGGSSHGARARPPGAGETVEGGSSHGARARPPDAGGDPLLPRLLLAAAGLLVVAGLVTLLVRSRGRFRGRAR